jgi:hypothetical protein
MCTSGKDSATGRPGKRSTSLQASSRAKRQSFVTKGDSPSNHSNRFASRTELDFVTRGGSDLDLLTATDGSSDGSTDCLTLLQEEYTQLVL